MDLTDNLFELIDMRSFSNLWFWIGLAVMWSTAAHWVIGVPYDLVQRARRHGGQAMTDLEDLTRIYTTRLLYIARVSGLILAGLVCFVLTSLALLGFLYGLEFAQALFLMALPMSLVGLLSLNTARIIELERTEGEELCKRLFRHRINIQLLGLVSVFVTALWGMYQNLSIGVL